MGHVDWGWGSTRSLTAHIKPRSGSAKNQGGIKCAGQDGVTLCSHGHTSPLKGEAGAHGRSGSEVAFRNGPETLGCLSSGDLGGEGVGEGRGRGVLLGTGISGWQAGVGEWGRSMDYPREGTLTHVHPLLVPPPPPASACHPAMPHETHSLPACPGQPGEHPVQYSATLQRWVQQF